MLTRLAQAMRGLLRVPGVEGEELAVDVALIAQRNTEVKS